jgi:hypothetical protein
LIVATHESEAVAVLETLWPQLMEVGLVAIENAPNRRRNRSADRLLRTLVPSPATLVYVENMNGILRAARSRWFSLSVVSDQIDRWLKKAVGDMSAVDALVGFLRSQPVAVQVNPGLEWIRTLVVDSGGAALTCGFLLVSWLTELRESPGLQVTALPAYRVILDALVVGNYRGARALQQRDE